MRQQRGQMRPADLGTRFDMAFEVVGVQLHQAGHDVIAAAVDRARRNAIAVLDSRDAAVDERDPPAQDGVGQDEARVGECQGL